MAEMYIVMQEDRRGGWSMLRSVDGGSAAGFRTADEAWKAIFDEARASGQYRTAKVERVVLCDASPVLTEPDFRI